MEGRRLYSLAFSEELKIPFIDGIESLEYGVSLGGFHPIEGVFFTKKGNEIVTYSDGLLSGFEFRVFPLYYDNLGRDFKYSIFTKVL